MTTKERLHKLIDQLPELESERLAWTPDTARALVNELSPEAQWLFLQILQSLLEQRTSQGLSEQAKQLIEEAAQHPDLTVGTAIGIQEIREGKGIPFRTQERRERGI